MFVARDRNRPGFTIIELLVVIAIVGILASMLLPALHEARGMARAASCTSNLKELGVALSLYQSAWNCYPAHQWKYGTGGTIRYRWFQQLEAMLQIGTKVQQCPEAYGWVVGRNNSYGYNYKYVGSAREFPDPADGANKVFEGFPVREVRNPSHTIAFGDSSGTGTQEPYEPIAFDQKGSSLPYDQSKLLIGNHGYTLDPTYIPQRTQTLWSSLPSEDLYSDKQSPSFIAPRHQGKANLCMVDGHVESLTPQEVYADNSWWNGYGREDPRDAHVPDKIPGLNTRFGW